jgi:hypothetical protein
MALRRWTNGSRTMPSARMEPAQSSAPEQHGDPLDAGVDGESDDLGAGLQGGGAVGAAGVEVDQVQCGGPVQGGAQALGVGEVALRDLDRGRELGALGGAGQGADVVSCGVELLDDPLADGARCACDDDGHLILRTWNGMIRSTIAAGSCLGKPQGGADGVCVSSSGGRCR